MVQLLEKRIITAFELFTLPYIDRISAALQNGIKVSYKYPGGVLLSNLKLGALMFRLFF